MKKQKKLIHHALVIFFLFALSLTLPVAGIAGEPKAGDIINSANVEQYKDYFPNTIQRFIKDGWGLVDPTVVHVQEHVPILQPKAFRDLSEKNKGKAKLDPNGGWLIGWEGGFPFPDPKEPNLADKILWNTCYHWRSDGYVYPDNYTSSTCRKKGTLTHGEGDNQYLFWKGRTVIDPKPNLPNNSKNFYFTSILFLKTQPSKDMRILTWRYDDPRYDDMWTYVPTLRRTLRMVSSERQNPVSGTATTWDDFYGFEGKITEYTPTFVANQKMLYLCDQKTWATGNLVRGLQHPLLSGPDDKWDLVPMWVIDVAHKSPRSPEKKKTLFVSQETYHVPYAEIYYKQGNLWKWSEWQDMKIKTMDGDYGPFQTEYTIGDLKTGFWTGCLLRHVNMNEQIDPTMFEPGTFLMAETK